MVRPVTISIIESMVGNNRIDLPQFAGYDIQVDRRGAGALTDAEFQNLPSGGFELKQVGDVFVLTDVFTITPLPKQIASVPPITNHLQYPHRVVFLTVAASVMDENRNWTTTPGATLEYNGRAEPKSGNGEISGVDGRKIKYDWMVYMPLPVEMIKPISKIEVYDGETLLFSSEVKRFSIGRFNAKAWV